MDLRKLYYQLPPTFRFLARRLIYLPSDIYHHLHYQDKGIPPKGMIFTGSGDFIKTGEKFVSLLKEYARLDQNSTVLDIGSGIGRLAFALKTILSENGSYEGFDAVEKGIRWCQENIGNKHPNFNFTYVDLKNDLYKNDGMDPSHFEFPYPSNHFDICVSISVYTHMLEEEVLNYLYQSSKVMKPGAYGLATFFLYQDDSDLKINPKFQFLFKEGTTFFMDKKIKRANVAYSQEWLFEWFEKNKALELVHIFPGSWRGSTEAVDFQDIIIFRKKA